MPGPFRSHFVAAWRIALLVGCFCAAAQARHRWQQPPKRQRHSVGEAFHASVTHKKVRKGDTLWALTAQVTGKPYVWPQIWALNAHLSNPHWIYPGDVVRFAPRHRVHHRPHPALLSSFDTTLTDPPMTRRARADGVQRVFGGTFITPQELAGSGCIAHAAADRLLLRNGDELFVDFDAPPQLGAALNIFRTLREVHHPQTGELLGFLSEITGEAFVRALVPGQPQRARVELRRAVREVERGQRVVLAEQPLLRDVEFTGSAPDVQATIVDLEGGLLTAGNQKLVFIDRGKTCGLDRGHGLVVQGRGDPLDDSDVDVPPAEVAWLLVVDAKDTTATCLVTAALREVWVGDIAVARSAALATGDANP